MAAQLKTEESSQKYLASSLNVMANVLVTPVGFYRTMPRAGGIIEPLMFMVAMGILSGLIRTLLGIFGMGGMGVPLLMALTALIITPVVVVIFGFIGAAILFLIWKIAGSKESFETAYRCAAFAMAIAPVTSLLHMMPYLGSLAAIGWMTYLMVVASVEVHGIEEKKAWIIFGILGAILALASVNSEITARKMMASHMDQIQKNMGRMGETLPGEAAKPK